MQTPAVDLDRLFSEIGSHTTGIATAQQSFQQIFAQISHQGGVAFAPSELGQLLKFLSEETGEALRKMNKAAETARRAFGAMQAVKAKREHTEAEIGMDAIIGAAVGVSR